MRTAPVRLTLASTPRPGYPQRDRPVRKGAVVRWMDRPIVAFDTETTGLNPWLGDRLIEFGAVVFHLDERGRIDERRLERHQFFCDPGVPIPPEVQKATNITDEDVHGQPAFAERAEQIWGLLHGALTVAHNYDFDQAVIASEFKRLGRFWPTPLVEIDTLDISRRYFQGGRGHKLGELCQRLEVRLAEAHRAANDAEACGRAFLAMVDRFKAPDELHDLIEWADGIGPPPPESALRVDDIGRVVFTEGGRAGRPVAELPAHLAWMMVARQLVAGEWQHRYPESVRRWAGRFLRLRMAGRAVQGGRSFGPDDWAPESCAVPDPPLS